MLNVEQAPVLKPLREEILHNINAMDSVLGKLSSNFPKAYKHALTQKAIRMLLCNERRTIRQMQNDGILSDKDAERLYESVDERSDQLNSLSHTIPASLLRWLKIRKRKE